MLIRCVGGERCETYKSKTPSRHCIVPLHTTCGSRRLRCGSPSRNFPRSTARKVVPNSTFECGQTCGALRLTNQKPTKEWDTRSSAAPIGGAHTPRPSSKTGPGFYAENGCLQTVPHFALLYFTRDSHGSAVSAFVWRYCSPSLNVTSGRTLRQISRPHRLDMNPRRKLTQYWSV